jgi:hypothetical protein
MEIEATDTVRYFTVSISLWPRPNLGVVESHKKVLVPLVYQVHDLGISELHGPRPSIAENVSFRYMVSLRCNAFTAKRTTVNDSPLSTAD